MSAPGAKVLAEHCVFGSDFDGTLISGIIPEMSKLTAVQYL